MKNSSQTQHRKSDTKRKEEQKNEAGSNGTVTNMINSAEKFATHWKFHYSLYSEIFAIIAKIRYHSEISLCSKNFVCSEIVCSFFCV